MRKCIAAMAGMGRRSGPGRARFKDVRTRTSKALSAHLFSVCSCRNLRQTQFVRLPELAGEPLSYARSGNR